MTLTGKVAIVTGAGGSGSGRSIACRLARESATVVLADMDKARLHATQSAIKGIGGQAALVRMDVGDRTSCAHSSSLRSRPSGA